METIPQSPGIYQIRCVTNNKVYVGSSKDLRSRWSKHKSLLKRGQHGSKHLQRAWDKYGETSFIYEVLELVMFEEFIVAREQYWIEQTKCFDRYHGFNMRRVADRNTGLALSNESRERIRQKLTGRKIAPEIVEKTASKRRGRRPSPQHIEAIRLANTGKKRTAEICKQMADARRGIPAPPLAYIRVAEVVSKHYQVTSPDGEVFTIKNLRKFCLERGLKYKLMLEVASGRNKVSQGGWTCLRVDLNGLEPI